MMKGLLLLSPRPSYCVRWQVLVRIMEFLCSLNLKDPRSFEAKMVKLGAMHRKMGIRPWMFSVFVEVGPHRWSDVTLRACLTALLMAGRALA